jgi:hypothetical protein
MARIWREYIRETIEHSHRVMALYSKPGRFGGKPVSFDFR